LKIEKNPYKVLGLSPAASQKQIRAKYRLLVQKYHPDLHPGDTAATRLMVQVNLAYNIIGNPEARRHYDEKLRASKQAAAAEEEVQTAKVEPPFEKTEEPIFYEEATVEETEEAEAWVVRQAQITREKGFVSSVWTEVTESQPQEYANGWVRVGHLAGLIFRVIFSIFVLLLRFLVKKVDEDEDFLKF
jgi:curved DNA-binding protein CbpA